MSLLVAKYARNNYFRIKILKGSFKSGEHRKKVENGPYFEVSAFQLSSVTLTIPGDENQRKAYCIFLNK